MQVWYLKCSYVGGGGVYGGLVNLTSSSYPSPYLARKLSKPEDGRYRPKHVVFFYC